MLIDYEYLKDICYSDTTPLHRWAKESILRLLNETTEDPASQILLLRAHLKCKFLEDLPKTEEFRNVINNKLKDLYDLYPEYAII